MNYWESIVLVFGAITVALTLPSSNGFIERRRGFLLLTIYGVYIATLLQRLPLAG
jgi:hypothetical protein